jgi:hypothetical protein
MNIKGILIALVIVGVACAGAVTWNSTQNSEAGSLVTNRPVGVAYAQDGGSGAPPPPTPPPAADPGGAAPADADTTAAPPPELTDEQWLQKLEEWKNSDPREIVEKKYDDLNSKQTDPSNEDDPENFIPETGRVDPLTIVDGAIPDELKPPRSGETDQNEVETYLFAEMATLACEVFGRNMEVYNVIQIGLNKIVSIRFFGQGYGVEEGQSFGTYWFSPEGWPVQVQISVLSAGTDEVVMNVTSTPEGSTVQISKNYSFIPR